MSLLLNVILGIMDFLGEAFKFVDIYRNCLINIDRRMEYSKY